MDDEDQRLLSNSLSRVVTTAGPGGLRAAVTGFGWHGLLATQPAVAVSILATLQGERLTDTTMIDDVVLAAAGIEEPARVVYPDLPHGDPTSKIEGGSLAVTGVVAGGDVGRLVVAARRGDEVVIATTAAANGSGTPSAGLDPDSSWHQVRFDLALSCADLVGGPDAAIRWGAMRAAGHRALAHELNAIGRRMLTAAVEHVGSREQFGRPLGSFQAVKHALADVRVWQECAEEAADAAWEDGQPASAELAKILAGRFVRTAAANCQQVLGGMGFTWEHEFHRYLRRALLLEPLLGSAAQLRARLGARLRTDGLPQLAQL